MTTEECKALLSDMRRAKGRARRIRRDIEEMERDLAALALKSPLGKANTGGGSGVHSSVEVITGRLAERRESFEDALTEAFELEDKLAAAIRTLSLEEQEVITCLYLRGYKVQKVADSLFVSRRAMYRIKDRATSEIARKLQ